MNDDVLLNQMHAATFTMMPLSIIKRNDHVQTGILWIFFNLPVKRKKQIRCVNMILHVIILAFQVQEIGLPEKSEKMKYDLNVACDEKLKNYLKIVNH
jgi:hypothetical protein